MTQPVPAPLHLRVNGEPRELPAGSTLSELLTELQIDARHTAVERNREIVPKTAFAATELRDGDVLEIVTLVGGG